MAQPWSGVVLSSARLEPRQDIIFRLITLNYAAVPVRKIDERTVEYSEEPMTVRVRLAYADDPWVRSVDPGLYQRWVQELGTEPVSFLERADQFVPGTRVDRWLFAILRSIWLNEIRSKRIREGAGFVDAADALTTDGASEIETNTTAAAVLRAIDRLPEAQRETILLVYGEGYSYA